MASPPIRLSPFFHTLLITIYRVDSSHDQNCIIKFHLSPPPAEAFPSLPSHKCWYNHPFNYVDITFAIVIFDNNIRYHNIL